MESSTQTNTNDVESDISGLSRMEVCSIVLFERIAEGRDFQLVPQSSLVAVLVLWLSTMTLEHWFLGLKNNLSVVGTWRHVPVIKLGAVHVVCSAVPGEKRQRDACCLESKVCGRAVVSPNQHYPDETQAAKPTRCRKKTSHTLLHSFRKKE